jgi:pSer/pThr/pTyr-binding forkhead associated (FHA) protein
MFKIFKKNPNYTIYLNEETGVPPIPVYDKKIIIGRGTNHILAIPDHSISRNHVEVIFREGTIFIVDLVTANGTRIDGELIPASTPIPYTEGQTLVLGQSEVLIQFQIFAR